MKYICKSDNLSIRKMMDCMADYALILKWLSDPIVLDYYEGRSNPYNIDKVLKKFAHKTKAESTVIPCIITNSTKDIGYVQYYKTGTENYSLSDEEAFQHLTSLYALDIFIGETNCWNKGIGTQIIQMLVNYLFDKKNADAIFIDPQTWNKRAIKCYEKCGFQAIKIAEKRELHDGEYKDSLIMVNMRK